MRRLARRTAAVVWPAFMVAGVLEIAVFAFVDPFTLHTLAGTAIGLTSTAVYSLAFFVFWVATAAASGLTLVLERSAEELNADPHMIR